MQIRLRSLIALALLGAVCLSAVISVVAAADPDFYQTLGVPKDATERQMKKVRHEIHAKARPDRPEILTRHAFSLTGLPQAEQQMAPGQGQER